MNMACGWPIKCLFGVFRILPQQFANEDRFLSDLTEAFIFALLCTGHIDLADQCLLRQRQNHRHSAAQITFFVAGGLIARVVLLEQGLDLGLDLGRGPVALQAG